VGKQLKAKAKLHKAVEKQPITVSKWMKFTEFYPDRCPLCDRPTDKKAIGPCGGHTEEQMAIAQNKLVLTTSSGDEGLEMSHALETAILVDFDDSYVDRDQRPAE